MSQMRRRSQFKPNIRQSQQLKKNSSNNALTQKQKLPNVASRNSIQQIDLPMVGNDNNRDGRCDQGSRNNSFVNLRKSNQGSNVSYESELDLEEDEYYPIRCKLLDDDEEEERQYLTFDEDEKKKIEQEELEKQNLLKEIEQQRKFQNQFNYYRFLFLFQFFQTVTWVATLALISEFDKYFNDSDPDFKDEFVSNYPNILRCLNSFVILNSLVIIFPSISCYLVNKRSPQVLKIFIPIFYLIYLGKFINTFATLIIDDKFNEEFSNLYQNYINDMNSYCNDTIYYQCRIVFAWNFYKYILILDGCITSATFVLFIYYWFIYKQDLVKDYYMEQYKEQKGQFLGQDEEQIALNFKMNNSNSFEQVKDSSNIQNVTNAHLIETISPYSNTKLTSVVEQQK